jgi:adenylate cyclase class 2
MLEVEMKFPVADPAALEETLRGHGARFLGIRIEVDHYFNAPDRDFARTDEAVRLRQVNETNVLTYKGPKRDKVTKTRTEIEVPLANGPEAAAKARAWLTHLGYRPTATLRKQRAIHHLDHAGFGIEICRDDVDGVGSFVELETLADEGQEEAAKAAIQSLARQLGLTNSERRSYLEMFLERAPSARGS